MWDSVNVEVCFALGKNNYYKELNGRIYIRDELSVWDELRVWDGWLVYLRRIPRLGINPVFRRLMWLNLTRLSARLQDVLTDESAEDKFSHIIRLNTGFKPRRVICLGTLNRLRWVNRDYFMESACVRDFHTSWWSIWNRTSERSERVRFLIQNQRVWKSRTKRFPCSNLFISYILRFLLFIQL